MKLLLQILWGWSVLANGAVGIQVGTIQTNNQNIKLMKMNFTSPIWLQSAGSAGKAVRLFYVTSNADGNDIMFVDTKLGAFADNVQYSTDNAETWDQLTAETVITLDAGETVYFRNYTGQVYNLEASKKVVETSDLYSIGGDITDLFYPGVKKLPVQAFDSAFMEDENLQDASALILPAMALAEGCYNSMFEGCTSLTTAPELPATALAEYCYTAMFYGCTSLTVAPELPAMALAPSCYNAMFYGCTSLTTAPELPATALTQSCYNNMFHGCTSLTAAPELPATALAKYCYNNMFHGCTSLTVVKCLATSVIVDSTGDWLKGVASTGTFTKTAGAEWPSGVDGIPTGWTVIEQ